MTITTLSSSQFIQGTSKAKKAAEAGRPVANSADSLDTADLYLSAITIQELEIGVLLLKRRDPSQGAIFRAW